MEIRFDAVRFARPSFDLSLNMGFRAGVVTALIGPSGSGKSTVLDLVAGFETPAEGRVLIGGVDQAGRGPADRPVSMVFQDNNLFPHMSVAQNVGLGLDPGLRLSADQQGQVAEVLDEVGLAGLGDRLPGQLSGGQQSRAALARALLRDRPVLLLDEPFSALGPGLRRGEMMGLVAEVSEALGLTVVMVTHEPWDARAIAAETAVVADGHVAAPEETRALFDNPPEALRTYLGKT